MKEQKINKVFDTSKYKKEYIDGEIIFSEERGKLEFQSVPLTWFKKAIDDLANYFEIDYIKIDNKKYGAII